LPIFQQALVPQSRSSSYRRRGHLDYITLAIFMFFKNVVVERWRHGVDGGKNTRVAVAGQSWVCHGTWFERN
jgi:hypothetical protein